MGLFGGSGGRSQTQPATSLRVQTALAGKCRPIVWGANRISGNLIYYSDFTSTGGGNGGKSGGKGGGGGGGKGGKSSGTTYFASVMLALCEGPIYGYGFAWSDQTRYGPVYPVNNNGYQPGNQQFQQAIIAANPALQIPATPVTPPGWTVPLTPPEASTGGGGEGGDGGAGDGGQESSSGGQA